MIWEQVLLYGESETGEEDELGNVVKEPIEIYNGRARHTPWTDQDILVNGRDVTMTEQRYAIPIGYEDIKNATILEIDGYALDITQIINLTPRWTVVQCKRYGS